MTGGGPMPYPWSRSPTADSVTGECRTHRTPSHPGPRTDAPGPIPVCADSREELRDLVLDAGREVLLSEGLGTGAEHLSFKRVLSHLAAARGIRVTNASVIGRIWENQEEFQLDVVSSVAGIQGDEEVAVTLDAFLPVLGLIDTSTPERRRASLAELIRVPATGTSRRRRPR